MKSIFNKLFKDAIKDSDKLLVKEVGKLFCLF